MARQANRQYKYHNVENAMPKKENDVPPANKPSITMKKGSQKKGSAPMVFLGAVSVLVLLCCVIYGKGETNKLYTQVSSANKVLEMQQSENARMQSEIESKMALRNVEDYAENVLGLRKLDKSQIEYIKIQTDDVVEIPEDNKNLFVKIKNKFSDVVEYLFG